LDQIYTLKATNSKQKGAIKTKNQIIKFYTKRVIVLYTKNLIVATALPVLNTHFSNKSLLFKIPISLRIRGYATESGNNNNIVNVPPSAATLTEQESTEGVPSLDDLFKFKEEIQKIREKEFDDLLESNICSETTESFEEVELKDWDIDELGFIYHSSSKESTSFDESFPNFHKERGELENSLNQVNNVNQILGNKRILELFKERLNSNSEVSLDKKNELSDGIKETFNNTTGFNFLKWNWKENNKLNIEVDLDKTRDVYNNTISVLKHLNLDSVDFTGKVVPFTGWMLAHRSFMNAFHRNLNRNQANKSPQEILRFNKQNFRNLALIHVLSLFCTGVLTIGFGHAIKNNTSFQLGAARPSNLMGTKEDCVSKGAGVGRSANFETTEGVATQGSDSISNSNIVKSLLPIFIKKFSSKLSNISAIIISIVIYIIFYVITNYFPTLLEYINYFYNYKTFGYLSIFVMFYIIYTLFELLIVYYFVINNSQENLENNKFTQNLPKYIKKDIVSFRENDSSRTGEDKDFFKKQYFLYILTHLISLIISFVIIIICLIIF